MIKTTSTRSSIKFIALLRSHERENRSMKGSYSRCIHLRHSSRQVEKPYHEIPTKKSWLPSSFGLLASGGPAYLHEHCDKRHRELGPIYRERLGPAELVFIADTKMIQTTIANEGLRPLPNIPEAWLHYNRVKSIERGLFFQNGEPWHKLRKTFNKILLANDKIHRFSDGILQINADLMKSWQLRHNNNSKEFLLGDLRQDLCKWSIESNFYMLFGERLNCIHSETTNQNGHENQKAHELVENVANMFKETSKFQVLPVKLAHRLNLKTWRQFVLASDNMLKIATELSSEYLTKIKQADSSSPSLVKDLLELETLDEDEISRSVVDLIIASADTTANALEWMFYLVGKFTKIQDKLRAEARTILSQPHSCNHLSSTAPYLKSFVKEAMRLYPTAPFLARTLDHEITLNGYKIPSGVPIVLSLYTTSRMSKYFEEPLEFRPERWMRTDNSQCPRKNTSHAYASLPFGIGARKCIGYKVADSTMCLLIASFVDSYESSLFDKEDLGIKLRMTLSPDRPVKLRLRPRE